MRVLEKSERSEGPGESGKSTIFKQMKIIEGREGRQGISEEERRGFTSIVRVNVLSQFKLLLQICKEENIPFPKQVWLSSSSRFLLPRI